MAVPLNYIYVAQRPRPAGVLCPEADLTAFALRLPAKGLGFMVSAQTAHRHAANPAPSSLHAHPVHDPCSREGDAGDYAEGGEGVEKRSRFFCAGGASFFGGSR